jgi:ankyrin repeat protein
MYDLLVRSLIFFSLLCNSCRALSQWQDGNTALIYASFHGYTIIVSLLLRKKKADVNIKNNVSNVFAMDEFNWVEGACVFNYEL